jgi:hypothetical protein
MRVRYSMILALTSALVLASPASSPAALSSYVANLKGTNENPVNASPATGMAFIIYDDVANTLTLSGSFSGLVAPLTAGHYHGPALPGVNASVIHGFSGLPLGSMAGAWTDLWALTPVQVTYLLGGLLYVNLHSQTFPGGEIRGQVVPDATPAHVVSWGRIKALYR